MFNRFTIAAIALLSTATAINARADQWTPPTPAELSMTAQPEVPGAPAVILFSEEITNDDLHMWSHYVRVKVLTDAGKKYGDVEIRFLKSQDAGSGESISEISGRTIQPDGTIVPFTGKPFEKLVEKSKTYKYMAKIFTLPNVQVGSILEYRYTTRWDDQYFTSPHWDIQGDLFMRKAHYLWRPTGKQLTSRRNGREQLTNTISWTNVLPPGAAVKQLRLPNDQVVIELAVENIKPMPEEQYMPPIGGMQFHVIFYYSPYHTGEEYWREEGKYWAKQTDKFATPGPASAKLLSEITAPGDTSDAKLKKIYAALMQFENTDYTRRRTTVEERLQGMRDIKTADDVVARKRGSSDQIAIAFVMLARSAGMKAYVMAVTNRDRKLFNVAWLSMEQLDDDVAIVNVDGKDQYFDPGSRFCEFGKVEWKHSITQGLRQAEGGSKIAMVPGQAYTNSTVDRVADLKMSADGKVSGTIRVESKGDPALRWRHRSLLGDETSLRNEMQTSMEEMLPGGTEVKVLKIENLEKYDLPLKVNYEVTGLVANRTSSRILFPSDIFLTNNSPTFVHEKRELGVYFPYSSFNKDAMRLIYPAGYTVESTPEKMESVYNGRISYTMFGKPGPNSITIWRNIILADVYFPEDEYPKLRTFYNKIEEKDHDTIVLKASQDTAAAGTH